MPWYAYIEAVKARGWWKGRLKKFVLKQMVTSIRYYGWELYTGTVEVDMEEGLRGDANLAVDLFQCYVETENNPELKTGATQCKYHVHEKTPACPRKPQPVGQCLSSVARLTAWTESMDD